MGQESAQPVQAKRSRRKLIVGAASRGGGLRGRFCLLVGLSLISSLLFAVHSAPLANAAGVLAQFNLTAPAGGPFPSNHFTVPDASQLTGLRVHLPKPDCSSRPSDCEDIDVLNELDGFNLQPRLSIPFGGRIDVSSVSSQSVFLVSLGSTVPGGTPGGTVVGIDQVVWDTFTNSLHVESAQPLDQHTRYVLVATKMLLDESGKEVKAAKAFLDFVDESNAGSTGDPALDAYRTSLRAALTQIDAAGIVPRGQVVVASVFTTQSVTAVMEKMRDQVKATTPAPADFLLGAGGSRSVFARSAVTGLAFTRQVGLDPPTFLAPLPLPLSVLDVAPGAVGTIAFGRFISPDYRVHPGEFIPPVGTLSGTPHVRGMNEVTFVLFLPSSPKPAGGYPVVLFAHGGGGDKIASGVVAAELADQGIATIAIDAPGTGFGPQSYYMVTLADSSIVTVLSGGRSIDQNGDGRIAAGEGTRAAPPRANLDVPTRDNRRQRVVDHMQLVREIEVGMDVDGDAVSDLDPSRIYFVGPSGGGRLGAMLLAVEPSIRAGVLTVPNGSIVERLSADRGGFGPALRDRVPTLINSPGITSVSPGTTSANGIAVSAPFFDENLPMKQGVPFTAVLQGGGTRAIRSPVTNTIPGAIEIQQVLENIEWYNQSASSVAYAPYIRLQPLEGVPAKSVIVQFAYGDRLVPNPSTTAILLAGDLADRTMFFRTDLRFAVNPTPFGNPNLYPHTFMHDAILSTDPVWGAAVKEIAIQAQEQIASFFALDGTTHPLDPFDGTQISDPDGAGHVFEVPIVLPLPRSLNYFP
jgi:hypothetical protein